MPVGFEKSKKQEIGEWLKIWDGWSDDKIDHKFPKGLRWGNEAGCAEGG